MARAIPSDIDHDACLFGGQAFTWWRQGSKLHGLARGTRVTIDPDDRIWTSTPERGDGFLERYLGRDRARPAALVDDPDLDGLARELSGVRLLDQDPWEALLAFMISPVNNVPRIQHTIARVCKRLGPTVDGSHLVPRPPAIAETSEDELRDLGLGFRAPRVLAAARAVDEGRVDLAHLEQAPIGEARDKLCELDGIGEKVAECVLCYGLNRDAAFPVDRWVARAGEHLLGEQPTPETARKRWGEDAAIAQQLIFHAARMGRIDGIEASQVARFDDWTALVDAQPAP